MRRADDDSDGTCDDEVDNSDIEKDEEEGDEMRGVPVQDVGDGAMETWMELEGEIFFTEAGQYNVPVVLAHAGQCGCKHQC